MSEGYRVLEDGPDVFRLDGEAGAWLVDGSVHVKVVTAYGDPVELTATEVRLLARGLERLADALDAEDAP